MGLVDPDKAGLPRVVDSVQISTKTKQNIRLLCNLIYDTAFSLRSSASSSSAGAASGGAGAGGGGSGGALGRPRLLEQKIPASYLALEDVVGTIAADRRQAVRNKSFFFLTLTVAGWSVFLLPSYFDNSEPRFPFQLLSSLLGGVKSKLVVILLSKNFPKSTIVCNEWNHHFELSYSQFKLRFNIVMVF